MTQGPFLSSALSSSCCCLSLLRSFLLAGLEFGFEVAASHGSCQLQLFCPKGQSPSLDTSLRRWISLAGKSLGSQLTQISLGTNRLANSGFWEGWIQHGLETLEDMTVWDLLRCTTTSYILSCLPERRNHIYIRAEWIWSGKQLHITTRLPLAIGSCSQLLFPTVDTCSFLFMMQGENLGFQTLTSYLLRLLCLFTRLTSASSREGILWFKGTVERSASRWYPSLSCYSVISNPKHGVVFDPLTFFSKAFINLTLVFIATHQGAVTNIHLYLPENGGFICSKGYTKRQRPTAVWILGNVPTVWWKKYGELKWENYDLKAGFVSPWATELCYRGLSKLLLSGEQAGKRLLTPLMSVFLREHCLVTCKLT